MFREKKTVSKKTDRFPWYELVDECEWEEDDFPGTEVNREADLLERLITRGEEYEIRSM